MSSDPSKTGQIVAVRIAGHEYKVRSENDPEALREIAGYVDRAMNRVRERTGTVDTFDVAVLTCLNLAREILSLREARTPAGSTAVEEDKLQGLIERVEEALLVKPEPLVSEEAPAEEVRGATTLELPSVESLRERDEADAGPEDDGDLAPPRVAAGVGDRAS